MSFCLPELRIEFVKRYPQLNKIKDWWNKLKNIKYKKGEWETDKFSLKRAFGIELTKFRDCLSQFSRALDFHHHIFKATEKYRQNLYAVSLHSKRIPSMCKTSNPEINNISFMKHLT